MLSRVWYYRAGVGPVIRRWPRGGVAYAAGPPHQIQSGGMGAATNRINSWRLACHHPRQSVQDKYPVSSTSARRAVSRRSFLTKGIAVDAYWAAARMDQVGPLALSSAHHAIEERYTTLGLSPGVVWSL